MELHESTLFLRLNNKFVMVERNTLFLQCYLLSDFLALDENPQNSRLYMREHESLTYLQLLYGVASYGVKQNAPRLRTYRRQKFIKIDQKAMFDTFSFLVGGISIAKHRLLVGSFRQASQLIFFETFSVFSIF